MASPSPAASTVSSSLAATERPYPEPVRAATDGTSTPASSRPLTTLSSSPGAASTANRRTSGNADPAPAPVPAPESDPDSDPRSARSATASATTPPDQSAVEIRCAAVTRVSQPTPPPAAAGWPTRAASR